MIKEMFKVLETMIYLYKTLQNSGPQKRTKLKAIKVQNKNRLAPNESAGLLGKRLIKTMGRMMKILSQCQYLWIENPNRKIKSSQELIEAKPKSSNQIQKLISIKLNLCKIIIEVTILFRILFLTLNCLT